MKQHSILIAFAFAALYSYPAVAQPAIAANGVRNSASYALPPLPNSGIAQGSIFVVFGSNLGPSKIVQVSSYPLPSSQGLSGTSIQVTINGASVYAIMLYTLATQLAAVLPSDTPVGTGTLTVTYNGQTSAPAPITVVGGSFGIFSVNQAGTGQGVFQNVNSATDRPFNSQGKSAQPGQVIILWGTGLGPVSGNEAAGPLPGDMPKLNVHVFVGGVEAAIQYRGRSGCCTGDDQIVFTVPAGVTGCGVPVYVQIDNVISNFVTMAIGPSPGACPDQYGLSGSLLQTVEKNGALRNAVLAVESIKNELPTRSYRNDNLSASFMSTPLASLGFYSPLLPGTCTVTQFPGGPYPPAATGLDAGTVSVATPVGSYPLPAVPGYTGTYGLTFEPSSPVSNPELINNGTVLTPGTITFTFTGGAKVGPGSGSIDVPLTFVWTNDAAVTSINRSQALTLTWSGATSGGIVYVFIQSPVTSSIGAELSCAADATLGTLTIPADFLSALPPSGADANGNPLGSFNINETVMTGTFTASGIDLGQLQFSQSVNKGPMVIQ